MSDYAEAEYSHSYLISLFIYLFIYLFTIKQFKCEVPLDHTKYTMPTTQTDSYCKHISCFYSFRSLPSSNYNEWFPSLLLGNYDRIC